MIVKNKLKNKIVATEGSCEPQASKIDGIDGSLVKYSLYSGGIDKTGTRLSPLYCGYAALRYFAGCINLVFGCQQDQPRQSFVAPLYAHS
jgi:hypothetical protein